MSFARALVRMLSPRGKNARHQTLIFHRVLAEPDALMPSEPTQAAFEQTVRLLRDHYDIIPLSSALQLREQGQLPRQAVSITFDDGYADNAELALPVLEALDAPATFFIATDYLDGGRMWNDTFIETVRRLPAGPLRIEQLDDAVVEISDDASRRDLIAKLIGAFKYRPQPERQQAADAFAAAHAADLPNDLMMTTAQLQAMAQSPMAEIGAHTMSHPILANCSMAQTRAEINGSMDVLEEKVGYRPRLFAYPNGKQATDYRQEQVPVLDELGLLGAVATDWGVMDAKTDRFQIPRFTPWSQGRVRFLLDMLRVRRGWL